MANTAAYSVSRGVRVARLLREQRNLKDVRACDLEALAAQDGVRVDEGYLDTEDFVAALVRQGSVAGILLTPNQHDGRRRFSIAHELGHFYIPTHFQEGALICTAQELREVGKAAVGIEQEANDFATELIMPRMLFAADADKLSPTIASATRLADPQLYNVSISAAAFRIVETTRERVMLVATSGGQVDWCFASRAWNLGILNRGDPFAADTLAHDAHVNGRSYPTPSDVRPLSWIRRNPERCGALQESCHWIGSRGLALSLIWAPEGGDDED